MADIRIKVAKDKAKLVKALRAGEGSTGPFQTYVDVLVFAASIGFANKKFSEFQDYSKRDPDPIPGEHFTSKGMSSFMELLAICHLNQPSILSADEQSEHKRVEIFEFYANGGLEIIEAVLSGSNDVKNQILLYLSRMRTQNESPQEEFLDLSFLES
jgi:dnd system-associated protein 4